MQVRRYDPERDRGAVHRIWREIGWLGDEGTAREALDTWVSAGDAHVALVSGEAECLVLTSPGTLRYLDEALPFAGVTGVATGRIARKQGFATRLTAAALAEQAAAGAAVAGLGMFDQGFYDRLGMGTGAYEHTWAFDPARLRVSGRPRMPRRLSVADAAEVHAARLARWRAHGSLSMLPVELTKGEMLEGGEKAFGLGYADGEGGALSHFCWIRAESQEHGPYRIMFYAYRNGNELLDLLRMVKALGDQVDRVTMPEPPGILLQDLIEQPFRQSRIAGQSRVPVGIRASAYWQCRILDVTSCVSRLRLPTGQLAFNLELVDPIVDYLPESSGWRGIGGDYRVDLGAESTIVRGHDVRLPTLKAGVGAFSRLWLGSATAYGLATTDRLQGPDDLLAQLDRLLRLPRPSLDWDL
ncbi:MAG: GNAT family N-acetyltransferase [Chloroflexi bacterium]|nr:GNAT family N-acetyltransferase [Chloroflexota bacterium]